VQLEPTVRCPQCDGPAEPEQDGGVVYFACSGPKGCGAEFGHHVERDGPVCAAGLPLAEPEPPAGAPVFLGTTITRRQQ
jgi:hypothetical protein